MNKDIVFLVVIAERKQKEEITEDLLNSKAALMHICYGKGSVKVSQLMEAVGLYSEQNKVVITCLMTKERSHAALDILIEKHHFNKPGTGIAFTVPVDNIVY